MIAYMNGSPIARIEGPLPGGNYQLIMTSESHAIQVIRHSDLEFLKEETGLQFGGGRNVRWEAA